MENNRIISILQILKGIIIYVFVVYFTASISAILTIFGTVWLSGLSFVIIFLWYFAKRKILTKSVTLINCIYLFLMIAAVTISMIVTEGALEGSIVSSTIQICAAPFILQYVLFSLYGLTEVFYLLAIGNILFAIGLSIYFQREKMHVWHLKKILIPILIFIIAALMLDIKLYSNRPSVRYAGHGFDYMNGYSSTDFTDYMVYSEHSKLATLDCPATLQITDASEMPVLDGAEACYPLYAAVAKAVYTDIDQIEFDARNADVDDKYRYTNGKIVSFTNTVEGIERVINKEVDIFFGARPSKDQITWAKECGVELEVTPIGKEAFVFFVENDNPVDNLTTDQIKGIYHGDILNWQEVGGSNQEIIPFQRPKESGSQTMMEYFMGDLSLREPKTYETVDSMVGVFHNVAQYNNEKGALGYSFRYFIEELQQEKNVKILSVDGISPTVENIANDSYPLNTSLCVVTRKRNTNPNVAKMIEFLLSPQGQELVEKTGYRKL